MLKKVALFGAAACFAVTTAASAAGWYVGADVGYQNMRVGGDLTTALGNDTLSDNSYVYAQGARGGIFTGYGWCLGNGWYFAPEFKASITGNKVNNSATAVINDVTFTVSDTFKLQGNLSLAARLGYYVYDNTMIYANVGPSWSKFKNDFTVTTAGTSATITGQKWRTGVQYGLGTEVNLTGQLGVRMEFLQTYYSKFNMPLNSAGTLVAPTKVLTNEANLGLVWTIGGMDA